MVMSMHCGSMTPRFYGVIQPAGRWSRRRRWCWGVTSPPTHDGRKGRHYYTLAGPRFARPDHRMYVRARASKNVYSSDGPCGRHGGAGVVMGGGVVMGAGERPSHLWHPLRSPMLSV